MSRSARPYTPVCSPSSKAGSDYTAQVQRCRIAGCSASGTTKVTETEAGVPVDSWLCEKHAKAEARSLTDTPPNTATAIGESSPPCRPPSVSLP